MTKYLIRIELLLYIKNNHQNDLVLNTFMFVRIFSFSKISSFSSLSTKRLFKMSTVMDSSGYFQFLVLNLTATT